MPGNVAYAVPVGVLPYSLSTKYKQTRQYALLENEYELGESQRSLQASTSRRRWERSVKLSYSDLETFRWFYDQHQGSLIPFYFYDSWETSPKFVYDPTGVATIGRYAVRFDSLWQQSSELSMTDFDVALVELTEAP